MTLFRPSVLPRLSTSSNAVIEFRARIRRESSAHSSKRSSVQASLIIRPVVNRNPAKRGTWGIVMPPDCQLSQADAPKPTVASPPRKRSGAGGNIRPQLSHPASFPTFSKAATTMLSALGCSLRGHSGRQTCFHSRSWTGCRRMFHADQPAAISKCVEDLADLIN